MRKFVSGDAEARLGPIMGFVAQARYVPDGSAPLDTDADLDIVSADSGVVVANHDSIGTSAFTIAYAPVAISNADGTALDSPQVQYVLLYNPPIATGTDERPIAAVVRLKACAKRASPGATYSQNLNISGLMNNALSAWREWQPEGGAAQGQDFHKRTVGIAQEDGRQRC